MCADDANSGAAQGTVHAEAEKVQHKPLHRLPHKQTQDGVGCVYHLSSAVQLGHLAARCGLSSATKQVTHLVCACVVRNDR